MIIVMMSSHSESESHWNIPRNVMDRRRRGVPLINSVPTGKQSVLLVLMCALLYLQSHGAYAHAASTGKPEGMHSSWSRVGRARSSTRALRATSSGSGSPISTATTATAATTSTTAGSQARSLHVSASTTASTTTGRLFGRKRHTPPVTRGQTGSTQAAAAAAASDAKRITYFYSGYYDDFSTFNASSFDTSPFTHVFLAFAGISVAFKAIPDRATSFGWPAFLSAMKAASPPVSTLLSFQSSLFPAMARVKRRRERFSASAVAMARSYGFAGLDMDWEFPSSPRQRTHLSLLLSSLRDAIESEAQDTGRTPLLLTAAVAALSSDVEAAYDVPQLAATLDWVNIMTYDLAGPWDGVTGEHTALQSPSNPPASLSSAITAWKGFGMPPSKMVMGLATYGYAYKLADEANNAVGAPISDTTNYPQMAYKDIAGTFIPSGATVKFDSTTSSMYAYKGTDWIGYDDPSTIAIKTKFFRDHGMAGYMFWDYSEDDASLSLQKAASNAWQTA